VSCEVRLKDSTTLIEVGSKAYLDIRHQHIRHVLASKFATLKGSQQKVVNL
jgi:hypothetical protein